MREIPDPDAPDRPWRIVNDRSAEREGEIIRYERPPGRPARFFIGSLMGPNYLDIDSLELDVSLFCAALRHSGFTVDAPAGWERPEWGAGWKIWIEDVGSGRLRIAELDITIPIAVVVELLLLQGYQVCAPE